ncbi:hypothetical protein HPB47_024819 [Ixodes persulcatus]|uniref:Uncharacterized protein n=1 Tax=Ixodes persulcatus TaxID=34615 RepID=A0AC60Q575_IXOPE|nr:hypothetical protein HPB47_024819 [Ixodes persulcatus]
MAHQNRECTSLGANGMFFWVIGLKFFVLHEISGGRSLSANDMPERKVHGPEPQRKAKEVRLRVDLGDSCVEACVSLPAGKENDTFVSFPFPFSGLENGGGLERLTDSQQSVQSPSVAPPGPRLFVVPGVLGFPTMASTVLPAKGMCFSFSVRAETAVDEIMDAFQVTAGSGGLKFLQHQGGTRFMSSVTSMSAANRLVAQGNLVLRDVTAPLEAVGVHLLHVSIYRLPPYVTEEAVVQAIAPFGKVKSITYMSYRDRPDILTETRVVKVEMTKPIPNFITIQGHQVMGAAGKGPPVPEVLSDDLDPSIRPRDRPVAPGDTPSAAGKMLGRRMTDALNEVVNRIRVVKRGGARAHLMSEYLAVLGDRHQRLLRLSSRTVVEQRLQDLPVDDPEAPACLRPTGLCEALKTTAATGFTNISGNQTLQANNNCNRAHHRPALHPPPSSLPLYGTREKQL